MMRFAPTLNVIGAELLPKATVVPFTLTFELRSAAVGVTMMLATMFGTVAVYASVLEENTGVSVPLLKTKLFRLVLVDNVFCKLAM